MRDVARMVLVLGAIGAISAGALAWVRGALAERIERQNDLHVRGPALSRLFDRPAGELLGNKLVVATEAGSYPVFFRREGGVVTGLAIEAAGHGGYGGDVVLMVAVDVPDGRIAGTEVIAHAETPGVGARIESPSFRAQWRGLPAGEPVALRENGGRVDAITGATLSSRAMVEGTNQVVALLRAHETEILARIAARGGGR